MDKKKLQLMGEMSLNKEKECAKRIINALLNKDSSISTFYEEYQNISNDTNKIIDEYYENKYEIDNNFESKFCYLLLECQDYINLSSLEKKNDKSDSLTDYLVYSKRKVFFANSYLHDLELLKDIWWFCETQEYNIHNSDYLSDILCKFSNSELAFRNYFLDNQIDIEIDDNDLGLQDNIAYIYTELRMKLTHYVYYAALISKNQDENDIILLLAIAFLSIINICKRYKIENLIAEDFNILIQNDPFLSLKEYYHNTLSKNLLLAAYEKSLILSDKYNYHRVKTI